MTSQPPLNYLCYLKICVYDILDSQKHFWNIFIKKTAGKLSQIDMDITFLMTLFKFCYVIFLLNESQQQIRKRLQSYNNFL